MENEHGTIEEYNYENYKNELKLLNDMQSDTKKVNDLNMEKLYSIQLCNEGNPILSKKDFAEMNLNKDLESAIYSIGINKPSIIQEIAIPNIMTGQSIVFHSKSGTGKTIAFVVCALQVTESGKGPQIIVLAPTRELSNQITEVFEKLASQVNIKVCAAVSNFVGSRIDEEVIVGTPGKVLGLLKNNAIDKKNIKMIVFDEADVLISERAFTTVTLRLLNMFEYVQKVFFSATYSEFAKGTVDKLVPNITKFFEKNSKPEKIAVYYCRIDANRKFEALNLFLSVLPVAQTIVFVGKRTTATELAKKLEEDNSTVACIHGDLSPIERDKAAEMFADSVKKILVTTDVFSRGMDIPQVNLIVNYDLPFQNQKFEETYIHRIGRAGRFNRCGFILDLITCQGDFERIKDTTVYKDFEVLEIDLKKLEYAFDKKK